MSTHTKGRLIIVGGHEEKEHGDCVILQQVVKEARKKKGHLVIITAATSKPREVAADYIKAFTELGIERIEVVNIQERRDSENPGNVKKLEGAAVVFFTGGDQLRLTSRLGNTPVYRAIEKVFHEGGTIVGTSAGAAAMPETMLMGGAGARSSNISTLEMAPGLALLHGVVVDTHFAQRGRIGRLLGAIAENPRIMGIGIDEDTAIVVNSRHTFLVIGVGAVYVLDGSEISYSSLSDKDLEGVISVHDVKLHVLCKGDRFDLKKRRPIPEESKVVDQSQDGTTDAS